MPLGCRCILSNARPPVEDARDPARNQREDCFLRGCASRRRAWREALTRTLDWLRHRRDPEATSSAHMQHSARCMPSAQRMQKYAFAGVELFRRRRRTYLRNDSPSRRAGEGSQLRYLSETFKRQPTQTVRRPTDPRTSVYTRTLVAGPTVLVDCKKAGLTGARTATATYAVRVEFRRHKLEETTWIQSVVRSA